ncbi:MAG: hypothetical protein ACFB22_03685 [Rhodothalassiaceae bacterium]
MNWALAILLVSASAAAAAERNTDIAIQRIAADAGEIIGMARHCQLDPVDIEDFYVAAEARINALSDGPEDRVMARIRLANTASIEEAKGPAEGCEAFKTAFKKRFQVLR